MTTRTSSSASAMSKAASTSSMSAVFWALATSGRFMVMVAMGPSTLYSTVSMGGAPPYPVLASGQTEHTLADDVALDLVGPGPDRRRLVVEPGSLPLAHERRVRSKGGHAYIVQPFRHLAPVQLQAAALRS